MTENGSNPNQKAAAGDGPEKACGRIRQLGEQLGELQRRSEKKRGLTLKVGIGLIAFCAIYLSFLTAKVFQIDAQALTEFGRLQVESQLPEGAKTVRSYFEEQAPELIGQLLRQALGSVSDLRAKLADDLDERSAVIITEFDEQLDLLAAEVIRSGRERVDEVPGAGSDVEKIDVALSAIAHQLQTEIDDALESLHPQYTAELGRVKEFLTALQEKSDAELTERERLQKELIQTTLELVARDFQHPAKRRARAASK